VLAGTLSQTPRGQALEQGDLRPQLQRIPFGQRLQFLEPQITNLRHRELELRMHIDQLERVVQQGNAVVLGGKGIRVGNEVHLGSVALRSVLGGLGSLGSRQLLGRRLRLGRLLLGQLLTRLLGGDHGLVLVGQRDALVEPQRLEDVQCGGTRDSEIEFANAVDDLEEEIYD